MFDFISAWVSEEDLRRTQRNRGNGTYSVTFNKGYNLFSGLRVYGKRAQLQGPNSDVELVIPEGYHGFVSSHAHTDITPFLRVIPESECLVSPIVEYNSSFKSYLFGIRVPHCVTDRKLFQHFRVWHGDICKNKPFKRYEYFRTDDQYLTIFTNSFCQFFCTISGCGERCHGSPVAFIFGGISPLRFPPVKAALRLYMCSPLYNIQDFKRVSLLLNNLVEYSIKRLHLNKCQNRHMLPLLPFSFQYGNKSYLTVEFVQSLMEEEQEERRHLLRKDNVSWNMDDIKETEFLFVGLQTPTWDPRYPIIDGQWFPETRRLIQVRKTRNPRTTSSATVISEHAIQNYLKPYGFQLFE